VLTGGTALGALMCEFGEYWPTAAVMWCRKGLSFLR
jgi:hypothetical protein